PDRCNSGRLVLHFRLNQDKGLGHGGTPIVIKDYAYIGMGAMLVSGRNGITIGEGAIIGAGSVVTRSIPDWKIAVGNPARVIRDAPRGTPEDPHPRHLFVTPEERTDQSARGERP
ncbi:MAG: acyltransferase, partial [Kiritimatiellia bacterium]